jgi:arylsulfatase A-like enzyme
VLALGCKAPLPPNIVFIVTDDQHANTLDTMPGVAALAAFGITFDNAFVTTPLCCPSRASFLTGQRAPTHGVERNDDGVDLDPTTTIAYALQAAGYETGLFGKYLNLYTPAAFPVTPPVGWDRWFAWYSINQYYNYDVNSDGTVLSYGSAPSDYSTDVFAEAALEFVESAPQPFFAYIAPHAPHEPATPAPRHAGTFVARPCPTTPATGEPDTADKPPYINEWRAVWPPDILETNCAAQNQRREALLAVDEMVTALVNAAAARGPNALKNTIFVYVSDNGMGDMEHWWPFKMVPYEGVIRVPAIVRYDKWIVPKGVTRSELVLNIDLAPTLAAIAGVPFPNADGADFSELYAGNTTAWRCDFPIEYVSAPGTVFEVFNPSWTGVRSATWKYVRYADGFEEFYDLADPHELVNLAILDPDNLLLALARTRHAAYHGAS